MVTLRCRHHMISHIIDCFGKDMELLSIAEETSDVNTKFCTPTIFFFWVMGYVGNRTITGPEKVQEE